MKRLKKTNLFYNYKNSFFSFFYLILKIFFLFFLFYIYKNNNIEKTYNKFKKNKTIKKNKTFIGRIFLSFNYNNEAEIAYVHLWRLYNYVDKFIFICSNRTYSGLPKNISFSPYEEKIKQYMDKIDIAYFDNICNKKEYHYDKPIRCFEKSQRDYGKFFIEKNYNPTEDDLLIVTDLDEILTREAIEYIKKNPPKIFYFLKGSLYFPYYYHKVEDWDNGCVVRYNKNMTTLSNYRNMNKNKNIVLKYKDKPSKPLITQCSYCFPDIEKYKNKFKSFCHQEFNKLPYISNNWIFKSHYCRKKVNSEIGEDEPYEGWKHLIPDDPNLKYLINRSFEYNISLTTYTKKDLETMCGRKYNRTPFE